uniref:Uncharacterized protein n=1 Tax=Sphaerodactylus townsendi TaxID=933632 RepID=A0ACB8G7V6_9SAUR
MGEMLTAYSVLLSSVGSKKTDDFQQRPVIQKRRGTLCPALSLLFVLKIHGLSFGEPPPPLSFPPSPNAAVRLFLIYLRELCVIFIAVFLYFLFAIFLRNVKKKKTKTWWGGG